MSDLETRCPRCGAPASTGRFCTNCGARLSTTSLEPSYDDTSTHDRIPPVPAAPVVPVAPVAPVVPPPLFRDEVADQPRRTAPAHLLPVAPAPAYTAPVSPPPAPRRSPGVGLWVAAAAGLVVVLVVGGLLLLGGGGSSSPSSSSTPPLIPKTHLTPRTTPTSSTTTSAPTTATTPTVAPTGAAVDVAGLARASAPSHAPAGVDFAGRPVTFVAPNMVDGAADTCWRTPGDATSTVLTFRLDQPTRITKVGLINGYAKTVFPGGRRFDWYHGDRRVLAVDWIFDDGTTVSQQLSDTRTMQTLAVEPVTTSTVRMRITSVSATGHGRAARNDTAISEVSLVGRTA